MRTFSICFTSRRTPTLFYFYALILWGVPSGVESFLQRIGRSNRRQNKTNVICLVPDYSQNILLDGLRFIALIDAAKKGELPIRSPYELFGAIGQQCLSAIASDNGCFTRIADLCKFFEHRDYLERDILEKILAELANNNYLQHHGFKNQYGADENLYRLVDYRMIYGNFGSGSRTIELRYNSKVLGEVPADNLLRLRKGNSVRFAGQTWRICKLSIECILVEPSQDKASAIDFNYSGKGIDCDAFIYNRIWKIIHSEELSYDILFKELKLKIEKTISNLRRECDFKTIPYENSHKGIRYFTFGGYFVNKAIALITRKLNYHADDISLFVTSPINWQSIPTEAKAYEVIFLSLFEKSSEQSKYQALLPPHLQLHEFNQNWLMDETVTNILTRLSKSTPIQVSAIKSLLIN